MVLHTETKGCIDRQRFRTTAINEDNLLVIWCSPFIGSVCTNFICYFFTCYIVLSMTNKCTIPYHTIPYHTSEVLMCKLECYAVVDPSDTCLRCLQAYGRPSVHGEGDHRRADAFPASERYLAGQLSQF